MNPCPDFSSYGGYDYMRARMIQEEYYQNYIRMKNLLNELKEKDMCKQKTHEITWVDVDNIDWKSVNEDKNYLLTVQRGKTKRIETSKYYGDKNKFFRDDIIAVAEVPMY